MPSETPESQNAFPMIPSSTCPACGAPPSGDAPGGFCSRCLARVAAGLAPTVAADRAGPAGPTSLRRVTMRSFGDYELEGEIASGGMGVVYLARQRSLNRVVALKMLRSGALAGEEEVRRFRNEAEAAANLSHPNIVPIHEVGEHEGLCYFSMKLIEGGHLGELNAACTRRDLGWQRRAAQLTATIARAVFHAHQHGVLHRDLKPTNILLDEAEEPHLTDFGLAKFLDDRPDLTRTMTMLGTPSYMAPEQVAESAGRATTATDIYSLGVILYELLTGRPPFHGASAMEVLDKARSTEAMSIRALTPGASADLVTICEKCMEKEPSRRYHTAAALAEDLENWLRSRPISARPSGRVERIAKWSRRNPLIAALSLAAVVLLVGGIAGVFWQWQRSERHAAAEADARRIAQANEILAQTEAARSTQVAQFMKDMLEGVGPGVARGQDTTLLRELMQQTAERLGRDLPTQPAVEADLRETLGVVYRDLGDYKNAAAMHHRAVALRRALHGSDHVEVATALNNLGQALHRQNEHEAAEAAYREALAIQRRKLPAAHLDLAATLNNLGSLLRRTDRGEEAERHLREALEIRRRLLGDKHAAIADSLQNMALLFMLRRDRVPQAEAMLAEALAIRREALGESHFLVVETAGHLAHTLQLQGRNAEAKDALRKVIELKRKVLGATHPSLVESLQRLAEFLIDRRGPKDPKQRTANLEEALAAHREALEICRKSSSEENLETAAALHSIAFALFQAGMYVEAEPVARECLEMRQRLTGAESKLVAGSMHRLAEVVGAQPGRALEGEHLSRQAIAMGEKLGLHEQSHPDFMPWAHGALGIRLLQLGKWAEAESSFRKALELAPRLGSPDMVAQCTSMARQGIRSSMARQGKAPEVFPPAVGGNSPRP